MFKQWAIIAASGILALAITACVGPQAYSQESQTYVWCKRASTGTVALFQNRCPAGWYFVRYDI